MQHTVLVIDDQWSVQEFARITLHTAGYYVLIAGDAVTGLCLARVEHPDVILLDTRMINREGCHLLSDLSQQETTSMIPIILIGNEGDIAPQQLSITRPQALCLNKPFRPEQLLALIDAQLQPAVPRSIAV